LKVFFRYFKNLRWRCWDYGCVVYWVGHETIFTICYAEKCNVLKYYILCLATLTSVSLIIQFLRCSAWQFLTGVRQFILWYRLIVVRMWLDGQ
jgi:hypothetical protein